MCGPSAALLAAFGAFFKLTPVASLAVGHEAPARLPCGVSLDGYATAPV